MQPIGAIKVDHGQLNETLRKSEAAVPPRPPGDLLNSDRLALPNQLNNVIPLPAAQPVKPQTPNWKNLPAVKKQSGEMSWYGGNGDGFEGGITASGITYNPRWATIASNTLPAGSVVRIKYNNRQYVAVVTDTGGFSSADYNHRIADASYKVASALGFVSNGTAKVTIDVLKIGSGQYYRGSNKAQLEQQIRALTKAQDTGQGITEIVSQLVDNTLIAKK